MTDAPERILDPQSSLVVTYHGTDPYFHQRDSRSPNRPPVIRGTRPGSSYQSCELRTRVLCLVGAAGKRTEMSDEARPLNATRLTSRSRNS
jgi:hypothetical protein